MQELYFAEDGNWGNAENILIVDIDEWTQETLDYVEDSSDFYRHSIVLALSLGNSLEEVKARYGN